MSELEIKARILCDTSSGSLVVIDQWNDGERSRLVSIHLPYSTARALVTKLEGRELAKLQAENERLRNEAKDLRAIWSILDDIRTLTRPGRCETPVYRAALAPTPSTPPFPAPTPPDPTPGSDSEE